MDPARGSEEQVSATTAAEMKVKTQVTKKLVQYAKLPPAAIPVENVTRTPPMKYRAAVGVVSSIVVNITGGLS